MKKSLLLIIAFTVILTGFFSPPAKAQEQPQVIPVLIDGLPVVFDVQPVIANGRTLVPFRAIAEALNVNVTWDGANQTILASDGKISVRLQIGDITAYRNEISVTLEAPPVILDGRTLIPLRFFSEAFNCQVVWDEAERSVKITSPLKLMTVTGFYTLGTRRPAVGPIFLAKTTRLKAVAIPMLYLCWPWAGTASIKKETCLMIVIPGGAGRTVGKIYLRQPVNTT